MDVKVYPSRLAGEIRAVDSKSAAHRAIFQYFRFHQFEAAIRITQENQTQHRHAILI